MQRALKKSVAKTLQFYWRRTRALTMGAQGMIFDDSGRILLIRHTYRPGWHFPGGGVETGESARLAVTRELHEEAGITCETTPRLLGLFTNFTAFPGDHIALFTVAEWSQDHVPAPNSEIAEQQFANPDALPAGTIAPVRRRLDEFLGRTEPVDHW